MQELIAFVYSSEAQAIQLLLLRPFPVLQAEQRLGLVQAEQTDGHFVQEVVPSEYSSA